MEIEYKDLRVKMEKNNAVSDKTIVLNNITAESKSGEASISTDFEVNNHLGPKKEEDDSYIIIKAPMVGTFYPAPSPESAPFVNIGDSVKKGEVVCIIEAMKLMNEIEAEGSGTVVEILAKEGQMVEYGEPLFKIKK